MAWPMGDAPSSIDRRSTRAPIYVGDLELSPSEGKDADLYGLCDALNGALAAARAHQAVVPPHVQHPRAQWAGEGGEEEHHAEPPA